MLALPTSALLSSLYGIGDGPQFGPYLLVLPGLLVGFLVATDRLGVTYHQIWKFSLASYVVALLGAWVPGLEPAAENSALAVGWWLVSVGVGVAVAQFRLRESAADAES